MATPVARETAFRLSDGLRLHVRDFRPRAGEAGLPVVALPGLTRDGRDFERLGTLLASHPAQPRRLVAIDARGRGGSDHAPDATAYTIERELADVLEVLDGLGPSRVIVLGTSRGGLLAMQMAQSAPARLAGAVLNDIGPVIETAGLIGIRAALAATAAPRDWEDAARLLREAYGDQFTAADADTWADMARRTYVEREGRPVAPYDARLREGLAAVTPETVVPDMWAQFAALVERPVLTIRGENSAVLSETTLAEMARRHDSMRTLVVRGAGHPPSLASKEEQEALLAFFADVDASRNASVA